MISTPSPSIAAIITTCLLLSSCCIINAYKDITHNKFCETWKNEQMLAPKLNMPKTQCPRVVKYSTNMDEDVRVKINKLRQLVHFARGHNRCVFCTKNILNLGITVSAYYQKYKTADSEESKQMSDTSAKIFDKFAVQYDSEKSRSQGEKFNQLIRGVCQKTFKLNDKIRGGIWNTIEYRNMKSSGTLLEASKEEIYQIQYICEHILREGIPALETFFKPIISKSKKSDEIMVDLFEGSEFMFGADLCVGKSDTSEDNLKCCYKWDEHKADGKNWPLRLFSQAAMSPGEKMGDSYGPHSWCGKTYDSHVELKYFKWKRDRVYGRFKDRKAIINNKEMNEQWRRDPKQCKDWQIDNINAGSKWLETFNDGANTKCPCSIEIDLKEDVIGGKPGNRRKKKTKKKMYLGVSKTKLNEFCEKNNDFCAKMDPFYVTDQFHPGSDFCFRVNNKVFTSKHHGDDVEGSNQCCYAHLNTKELKQGIYRLIIGGTAAGTPDKGNGFKGYHQYHDVAPVSDCGVAEYLKYRPPFKGGPKCKDLLQSPMMLSEAELVKDPKNAFVVPRKMKVTAEQ